MSNSFLQQWIYRAVIIVLIILISGWMLVGYVERSLAPLEQQLTDEIEQTIVKVQQVTKHGSDALRDSERPVDTWLFARCSSEERREFEGVLSRLGTGLSAAELQHLQSWFDRCGTVVAYRNAYIAQEVRVATENLHRLFAFHQLLPDALRENGETQHMDVETWYSYADAWQEYAAQEFVLDELQRDLIDARAAGISVEDPRITDLLTAVENEKSVLSERQTKVREIEKQLKL